HVTVQVLVHAVVERDLDPPEDEGAGACEHDDHRGGEADDEPYANRETVQERRLHVPGSSRRRKPMPRTVSMLSRPKGRSSLARSFATWTSIALLRRSASPSQTSSRICTRVTTRPARSASAVSRSNSRAVNVTGTSSRETWRRLRSITRS